MKTLNQIIHKWLCKCGLLKYTDCIERGCEEYHGRSPSQLMLFDFHRSLISFHTKKGNGKYFEAGGKA